MRSHPIRPPLTAAIGLALAAAALFVVPGSAAAFTPTVTCSPSGVYRCQPGESPKQVRWKSREVTYHVNEAGSDDIPTAEDGTISPALLDAINDSFAAWNQPAASDLELVYGGLTTEAEQRYDDDGANTNVVTWIEEDWASSDTAYALTSVTFSPDSGLIVDADVEFNGAFHTFTDVDDPRATLVDVRNTMTHEAGHFLGLDHSDVHEATMYASAPEGETQKRTLHQDDIEGLVHIYPLLADAPADAEDDEAAAGPFCASTGAGGPLESPLSALALLALGLGLTRLRRRRSA